MPVVPPALGNPYPTVGLIFQFARQRVNDMLNTVDGDLLISGDDPAPYTQTMLTSAWRWYQAKCASAGVETMKKTIVLYGLPVQATQDAADEAYVTWLGCSDGVNQYDGPALPQDLIQPVSVRFRQSGQMNFCEPVEQATDGLPGYLRYDVYDWRDDGMYFYAPQFVRDMKLQYAAYRPDLDATNEAALVPMMFCEDCLGARLGFEFANARKPGGAGATSLSSWSEKAFEEGAGSRTSRRRQRGNFKRIPYSGRRARVFYPVH